MGFERPGSTRIYRGNERRSTLIGHLNYLPRKRTAASRTHTSEEADEKREGPRRRSRFALLLEHLENRIACSICVDFG